MAGWGSRGCGVGGNGRGYCDSATISDTSRHNDNGQHAHVGMMMMSSNLRLGKEEAWARTSQIELVYLLNGFSDMRGTPGTPAAKKLHFSNCSAEKLQQRKQKHAASVDGCR
eukprot:1773059-Rhodomonas_salina.1